MILTIKGADFSAANIGTLNTVSIRKVIGRGVVHSIPNFVEKGSSVNWTITLNEDYEFGSYTITMGGEVVNAVVDGGVMTISIANVTGAISISVATTYVGVAEPEQPDMPDTPTPEEPEGTINAGLTLYQGYVDNKTVNDELNTRVKTDMIKGPFRIEVNDGYLIRAIWEYPTTNINNGGTAVVKFEDNKKSYTFESVNYAYITFSKSDVTQPLSPTEDIVKSFTTDIEIEVPIDSVTVNGIEIKLGQVLGTSLKTGNKTRAYTSTPINEKTTLTTPDPYVMIPLGDIDDTLDNGSDTFYTNNGTFNMENKGALTYHSTINVDDLKSAAPNRTYYVMFKRNDGTTINLEELQNSLTIN